MASNDTPAQPPIIIIRKKVNHKGHHGGAWKVAYADFVTAMMALFIVLWLMNSSEQVRKAISAYFKDPSGTGKMSGSASTGTGETVSANKDDMSKLKDRLEQAVKRSPEFAKLKDYVQMSVTGEGLRVELIESERGMFFDSGSSDPTEAGAKLIRKLADELSQMPNDLVIEGYTDARPFSGRGAYSNWELSTERANAARRLMEGVLRPNQVIQVRGFGDQSLRDKEHPEDPSNRRISVIVRYLPVLEGGAAAGDAAAGANGAPNEKPSAPKH
jgi:chemotaxis protein MotB